MSEVSSETPYFVPAPSRWPIVTALAALLTVSGFALLFNAIAGGGVALAAGLAGIFYAAWKWWGDVAAESERGVYRAQEDASFRWGMGWFIFSEVMFFAAFFGALFYARALSVPDLGGAHSKILWPSFLAGWPTGGPHYEQSGQSFETIPALGVPLINTLLLLSSGATVTWAHWALKLNRRRQLVVGLAATITLGVLFLFLQAYEYAEAYGHLNLKLSSGIYGSTFFMLTGFHGLHVTLGAISLTVILARCIAGHFTPERHFGFEAVAWYWHFVDVVWLLLFVLVYWI